jgi:hypothetical protein
VSAPAGLRAGLIGLGAMGRNHARVLNSLDGVQLVGVLDPAPNAVAPFGVPVISDLDQLLALRLDYAVIACPTALHEEIGLRLAEAGVHALIEKPLAPSVAAAQRPRDWSERSATSSATTRPCRACGPGSRPANSATSTRSSRGGRARSRAGSPTSAW